ncbi:MAG TPA: HutD family protein [Bryobacteraceae bacterium]|jgi:environmental stress-induced protein Ves|nr:HutD family protein [Bryobacteraceae bacterium]
MKLIDVTTLPAAPWKNGGGATRTIAVSPPDANFDNFDWRVSIAEVSSSGEFSLFPGVDRTILLLDGDGMILHLAHASVALTTPREPFNFSGDDAVQQELVNGPTRDFNVMTRRGRTHAEVQIHTDRFRSPAADSAVFYCASGAFNIGSVNLNTGCALLLNHLDEINFTPQTPDALLIAVLVTLEYS